MSNRMIRILTMAGLLAALHGADTAWPALEDPIGLGPRLVTIAWLADHGTKITAGMTDSDILAAYNQANAGSTIDARPDTAADPIVTEQAEVYRLRYLLRVNHQIDPAEGTDLATLAKLLTDADATKRKAELADARLAAGRVTVLPPVEPQSPAAPAQKADPSAPVPLRYQIAFKDLIWKTGSRSTGAAIWKSGNGSHEYPRDLGGIWARWVKWNDKDVRITSFAEDAPEPTARFTVNTEIGSFQATRLTENAWEVVFTDNAGSPLTFRTCASEALALDPVREAKEKEKAKEQEQAKAQASAQTNEWRGPRLLSDPR